MKIQVQISLVGQSTKIRLAQKERALDQTRKQRSWMDRYYNNQRSQKGREQHILYIQGVPKKRTNKTNKNGQTWQACQHSKVVQKCPDGPKMVPNCEKHLGLPFWILLDPFGPLWNVDKPAMLGHFCLFYWCAFLGHPVFYPNRWLSIRKWLQNDSLQIKPVEASRAWRDVIRQLHDKASPALKVRAAWKPFHTSVLIIICERVCQKGWISI